MFELFEEQEELKLIQQTAREFAENEIKPFASEWDQKKELPREILKKLAEQGFMGMLIPEEYGGSSIGHLALSIVITELSKACASTAVTVSVHNSLVASPILHFGTEEQKRKYFPKMATAEILGAYCLSEPDAGSDAASLSCQVRKEGDYYYLTGTKTWITNGAWADLFIVFATLDKTKRSKGICAFLVERDFPGLKITKPFDKLGIRASSTVEMVLENCRVPKENLLGEEGQGFKIAMHTLDGGRIGIAAQALGIAEACLEASIQYSKERKAFGQRICDFQAIQHKLANMAMEIEAARLLIYQAAYLKDKGLPHSKQASMAKLFASEMANRAAKEAVQIHGGVGYTTEFPVERYYRDAKITEIYEGTSEIQRLVIARHLLRDPK